MSKRSAERREAVVTITPAELEVALDLLGRASASDETRILGLEVAQDVGAGVFLYGLVFGLITIWFDRVWGYALLAAAGIALTTFAALPRSTIADTTRAVRSAVDGTDFGKAAASLRTRRQRGGWAVATVMIVAFVIGGFGLVAFARGLVLGDVSSLGLIALALSSVLMMTFAAVDAFRDYRYYNAIAAVREQLEVQRLNDKSDDTIDLTPRIVDVLSQAETHLVDTQVAQAVEESAPVVEDSWSLAIGQTAQDDLMRLASEAPDSWAAVFDVITRLQSDPNLPGTRPAAGLERLIDVPAGDCSLDYSVDEDSRSVYIVSVDAGGGADG